MKHDTPCICSGISYMLGPWNLRMSPVRQCVGLHHVDQILSGYSLSLRGSTSSIRPQASAARHEGNND